MSLTRRLATLTALGLASAGLVGVSAQPSSAAEDATLDWAFSDYLFNPDESPVGFTSRTTTAGASESATGIVFGGGAATGSLESGDLHLRYDGSVTFTWHASITFTDPEVVVEGDEGRIIADVGWAVPDEGSADDVVLTTFDPSQASVDGGSFSATPAWADADESWAPELLAALPSSVQAFFRATGSSSDARKAPATFSAVAGADEQAAPSVSATTSYSRGDVVVVVAGSDFSPMLNPPREDGVYVALAPAGEFPETDDFEDQDKVADADWVSSAQLLDGSFEVDLDPAAKHLRRGTDYAVYTWQAHAHTNAASDTETPVSIKWGKVGQATKLKTTTKRKKLVVTVGKGARGEVGVRFTKGKAAQKPSSTVKKGKATVKLPRAKGAWKAVVRYTPATAEHRPAKKKLTVRVR